MIMRFSILDSGFSIWRVGAGLVIALMFLGIADARVVRPAADFAWATSGGEARSLKSLAGQPVVLLIAPSPTNRKFRAQVKQLESDYQRMASKGLVCFAAFTEEGGRVGSNIPFVVVADGPRVGFLYEIPAGFAIAIIGPDGNLDYLTDDVVDAQRVIDVMNNNAARQEYLRKE
jgi:hypothetical protein